MRELVDDFGTVFRRGVPTSLNVHDWQLLAKSAAAGSFLFLKPESSKDNPLSGKDARPGAPAVCVGASGGR